MGTREQEILIITEYEAVREELDAIFRKRWQTVYASKVTAALSIIKNGLTPTLIIVDSEPKRDETIKAIERIRKHLPYCPMMMIDTAIPKDYELQYLINGVSDFIHKPFSAEIVLQRVGHVIRSYNENKYIENELLSVTAALKGERKRMMKLTLQLMSSLASTIDAKDEYTNGHSNRVSMYSIAIARAANCFSEKEMETLVHASLLHDIGKIGISDAIIRKPGRLSDEEYEAIQNHPLIGWNILKNVSMLPGISWVARWHHERYDGRGYPDGISGDAIPVMVRIVSIADSYDAMTSNRSYRKAMSNDVAIKELLKARGTQFDPHLVDIAVPLIESGSIKNPKFMDFLS